MNYFKKYIFAISFFLPGVIFSQLSIQAKATPIKKVLKTNKKASVTSFFVTLSIRNNTNSSIQIPESTIALDKSVTDYYTVGMNIISMKSGQVKSCDLDVTVPSAKWYTLNPGETGNSKVEVTGTCFLIKGTYKVTFFIKVLKERNTQGKEGQMEIQTNPVLIKTK